MKSFKTVAWWLLVIGGLNWLLVGLGYFFGMQDWNLVNMLFGSYPMLENLVYVLVGLSAIWMLWDRFMAGSKR